MTPEKVRDLLYTAAKLRTPNFRSENGSPRTPPGQKIEKLEDHLLLVARWRGALEEGRLYMFDAVKTLEDQWDQITGWETIRVGKTEKSIVDAKRKLKPELYDGIREGKWLIARLTEQIRRLERDEEHVVSRAYTMLTS